MGAALAASAGEPGLRADAIEIPVGETTYFQLLSTVPGQASPVVRVPDPSRDYSVVKITFESGQAGARKFRLRNGYDEALSFAMDEACSGSREFLLHIVPPGTEAAVALPAATTKVVLCRFTPMMAAHPL